VDLKTKSAKHSLVEVFVVFLSLAVLFINQIQLLIYQDRIKFSAINLSFALSVSPKAKVLSKKNCGY
jgi:hypothetical protein